MMQNDGRLLSLREATRHIPLVDGKARSTSTLCRWCRYGINRIKLEHVRVGRNTATTADALDRLFKALAEADTDVGLRHN